MIRTLIALFVTLARGGAALAAPPAVSPPAKKPAAQQQKPDTPKQAAEDAKPETWTWFGMGFDSRRSRMGEDDDFPAAPRAGGSAFGERSAAGNAGGR